jgi:hypothetical protein
LIFASLLFPLCEIELTKQFPRSGDEPLVILDALEDWRFAKNVRSGDSVLGPLPLPSLREVLIVPHFLAADYQRTKCSLLRGSAFEDL